MKLFKRLKPNFVNNKPIFGFDVETYQTQMNGYIKQDFLMGSVVGDDCKKVFYDREEMAYFLTHNRKLRNSYIMATNLEFDFQHVFTKSKLLKDMFIIDRNGVIYAKYQKDVKHKWEFIDTWNYQKTSVEKMGKHLGIKKLPYPKCFLRKWNNEREKQEMVDYNIQDSLITQKFGKFMIDFCNTLGCKLKLTIASTGMDNWRRNYQPVDIFQERRKWLELHYKGSFHGGRTEMFKRGYFGEKDSSKTVLWHYDYNSHYPAVCKEGIDGKGIYPDPSSAYYKKKIKECYINSYDGITHVKMRCPQTYIPLLGVSSDKNKYVFPTGIIDNWFTNIEIREAIKEGYELIDSYEGIFYTKYFKPFRNCVDDLYKLRMNYRKENNTPMAMMIKIMMNGGLFGKFNQSINDKTLMFASSLLQANQEGQPYVIQDNKKIYLKDFVIRGDYIFEKVKRPKRIPIFIHPILGSYTTSLARIKLYRNMKPYEKYVVYTDTDSYFMKKNVFESSDKLGALKLENKVKEAIFLRPKMYFYNNGERDIFKSKGLGSYIKEKKDFNDILNNKGIKTKRFTKIKESAIRKLPFSSIIDVNKHISLEDDKRIWKKKFRYDEEQDSKPISIS